MTDNEQPVRIKKSRLKKLSRDPEATAKAMQLVYVNAADEGITRIRSGKGFTYKYQDKTIKNKADLERIRLLVLPPAWEDVWICPLENGHLQATGKDVMKRKQYRYHPLWNQLRNTTKFYRMLELGKVLPGIRKQIQKDLALPGLPRNKVLAAVISLMEKTGIRIGNEFYEKLYGSFGLTTLKDKHVNIKGAVVKFTFRGKKGVEHQVSLKSKKLAMIVNQCKDIPGKELFQYIDEEGKRQTIESGMVNEYIKEIAAGEFTAKDFRTWCGSIAALTAIREIGFFENEKEAKKKMIEVLDRVSQLLGNTRTVCKKYYVHPSLLDLYENGKMEKLLTNNASNNGSKPEEGLQDEERIFMHILETL
jgi:DNA topoisomerase-1